MEDKSWKDVTYLWKSSLSASKGANEKLHVTLGERRDVDLLGVVGHDDSEYVSWMVLGSLK